MILRAVESIGGAEDSRWEDKEDRERASVARTVKHPNADGGAAYSGGGCPQGTISAIGPRENFSSLQKR